VAEYDDLIKRAEQLGVPVNSGVYKPSLQITDYNCTEEFEKRSGTDVNISYGS